MNVWLGVGLGLLVTYLGRYVLVTGFHRLFGPLPEVALNKALLDTPGEVLNAIIVGPLIEEILCRGPILLIALWFGAGSVPAITAFLVISALFSAVHFRVIDKQFVATEWSEQERRKVGIAMVLSMAPTALVCGALVLLYQSLWPAILVHIVSNAIGVVVRWVTARRESKKGEEA